MILGEFLLIHNEISILKNLDQFVALTVVMITGK